MKKGSSYIIQAIAANNKLARVIFYAKERMERKYKLKAIKTYFPSLIRKCNTWRCGCLAGTLGAYGKGIQAFESGRA